MILQKGITGFWQNGQEQVAPEIDMGRLKSLVLSLNQTGRFKVSEVQTDLTAQNYIRYHILSLVKGEKFDLLFNAHYPYYCGVTEDSKWMNLRFIEVETTLRSQLEPPLQFLGPELLDSEVSKRDLGLLTQVELDQIAYWKSSTFGEIIFNGYD